MLGVALPSNFKCKKTKKSGSLEQELNCLLVENKTNHKVSPVVRLTPRGGGGGVRGFVCLLLWTCLVTVYLGSVYFKVYI